MEMLTVEKERSIMINEIEKVEDLCLLRTIRAVLLYGKRRGGRISIEQYNRELNEAIARIDSGKFITQEDLEKEAVKW